MPKKRIILEPKSQVIVDCRDGSKDYWIATSEAKRLFAEGKLAWDQTNQCYTESA